MQPLGSVAKPSKKALLQIQNKMNENITIQIRTNSRFHLPFFQNILNVKYSYYTQIINQNKFSKK